MIFVYLFLSIFLQVSGNAKEAAPPLFVSLGSSCNINIYLKDYGLRNAAFPFDWILSIDGDRFAELLERDFQDFLKPEYLITHETILVHSYYHLEFRHDFEPYAEFCAKYQRRIDRFRQLDQHPGKVFFIREPYVYAGRSSFLYWADPEGCRISPERALRLNQALKKLFPHLDFLLVTINHNDQNLDEIKNLDGVLMLDIADFFSQKRYTDIIELLLKL